MPSVLRIQSICGTFLLAPLPQLISLRVLDIESTFLGPWAHFHGIANFFRLRSELHIIELFCTGVVLGEWGVGVEWEGCIRVTFLFYNPKSKRLLQMFANDSPSLPSSQVYVCCRVGLTPFFGN